MMRRKGRKHYAAVKGRVSCSGVLGEHTLAELAGQFDVNLKQIQDCKGRLLD